jgi:Uma2 family endonuclease
MTTALRREDYFVTPEQYLASERLSETKHEYVAGKIYAMAGASVAHERIGMNITRELGNQLRGRRCEVFSSNLRVRIQQPGAAEFYYYPDAIVDCSALPNGAIYAEEPAVIFEVISPESERIDSGEKLGYYRTLPSLRVYVLINQFNPAITIYRRTGEEWQTEFLGRLDAVLELPEIECQLPLSAVYERVDGVA